MKRKKFAIGLGVVFALFITVIIVSIYIGTRPPSTDDESALEVELVDAESRGLIEVNVYGANSLEQVTLDIVSRSDDSLKVIILPGTIFEPRSESVQNMVVIREKVVAVEPGTMTESIETAVACADMQRGVPSESDEFTPTINQASPDLIALLNLPDFGREPFHIQQFAIWTITDNPSPGGYAGIVYGFYNVVDGPSDADIERIRTLFEEAEISTGKYRAFQ